MEELDFNESNNYINNKITPLFEKYKPKKIDDIVGNKKSVQIILNWLSTFEEVRKTKKENKNNPVKKEKKKKNKKKEETTNIDTEDQVDPVDLSGEGEEVEGGDIFENKKYVKSQGPFASLLLIGSHGIGKTSSICAILNERKYIINILNFHKLKTTKNINELIDNIKLKKQNVYDQLYGTRQDKTAIIIDNLESITTLSEKNCIKKIIEINEEQWLFPLIFISNTQHSKFINEIDKKSQSVRFWPPFPEELKRYTVNISKTEGINIIDYRVYDKIINFSQNDIRKILYILQDMKETYGNKSIDMNSIVIYLSMFKKKDIDITLLSSTKIILQNYGGFSNILKQHEIEKVTLPLMVHQNYLDYIDLLCEDETKKYELLSEISNDLSKADIVENYMYGFQIWNLYEVQGIYSCVLPSYYITKNTDTSMSNNISITYTKDPNRTSIKKINKKNKLNINKVLKNLDIMDCVYINQIIRDLIESNKTEQLEKCRSLLQGYKLSINNLDTLLKIDKTKTSKNIMDSTIRSKLSLILNNMTEQKKRNNKEPKIKKTVEKLSKKKQIEKSEKSIEKNVKIEKPRKGKIIMKYKEK
jgi:hypothetical protein